MPSTCIWRKKQMNLRKSVTLPMTASVLIGMLAQTAASADWIAINNGLQDRDVHVLAINPIEKTTLYAGGNSGVFKSVDGGANWTASLVLTNDEVRNIPQAPAPPGI